MPAKDYIRERFFPHMWCPGCGHGTVLNALLRAVEELGIDKQDLVMVSGIGCSARISGYVDFHSMHTLHGRALAFATGIKMSKPELNVIVPMGDGDALAIGGNHFIHAARRNIDMTAIVMNNRIYGMTGGQVSPLSGCGTMGTTVPYGNIDNEFNIADLSVSAGATFVARTTVYHVRELAGLIKEALTHKGFSVLEVMSQCPTQFGRRNKAGDAAEMLEGYKKGTARAGSKKIQENPELIQRGVFVKKELPEYCSEYSRVIEKAQGK
ncbi:MAG: 2-oxoacid:ferredoxin oxidoreductase subunit beta [Desulfosalsimonas sp.]